MYLPEETAVARFRYVCKNCIFLDRFHSDWISLVIRTRANTEKSEHKISNFKLIHLIKTKKNLPLFRIDGSELAFIIKPHPRNILTENHSS